MKREDITFQFEGKILDLEMDCIPRKGEFIEYIGKLYEVGRVVYLIRGENGEDQEVMIYLTTNN